MQVALFITRFNNSLLPHVGIAATRKTGAVRVVKVKSLTTDEIHLNYAA